MVHLLPLPGSPGACPLDEVLARALSDAEVLLDAGFDGLVVENFGDTPFHKDRVEPVTVAAMTRVAAALRKLGGRETGLCINVLRNDARAALAVASAVSAQAIRVNVHCGARLTDQGVIEGRAAETLRLRDAWSATDVAIWADLAVKHSTALGSPPRPFAEEAAELAGRAGADALIVTGAATGASASLERVAEAASAAPGLPVLVGSGVGVADVASVLTVAHGAIVGTAVKLGGVSTAEVDPARARALVAAAASA